MRVGIKELTKQTGLTEYAIRQGIRENRIPYYQVGSRGKFIFDTELVEDVIRKEMLRRVKEPDKS